MGATGLPIATDCSYDSPPGVGRTFKARAFKARTFKAMAAFASRGLASTQGTRLVPANFRESLTSTPFALNETAGEPAAGIAAGSRRF